MYWVYVMKKRVEQIDTNNKIYKIVLLTVGVLSVVGIIFNNYIKLDEPVFFEHYYDIGFYTESEDYEEIPSSILSLNLLEKKETSSP